MIAALAATACAGTEPPEHPPPALPSASAIGTPPSPDGTVGLPTATSTVAPGPALAGTAQPSPETLDTQVEMPLRKMRVQPAFPALSFRQPVALTYADDGSDHLVLALQAGRIVTFLHDRAATSATTFLDITERVSDRGDEEGLLGLAFDPQYRLNGYLYVYYTASQPRRSVISRFSVAEGDPNAADPSSERVILEVPQPYANHNGGQLVFGPDGYLYIGLGDGGSAADPHGNGQNTATLLGSILRIDVSTIESHGAYAIPPDNPLVGQGDGAREEIWAYGLRNPWRFTFDRLTGDMWAADVGQNRFEEIDIIRPGVNYGWNVMEGLHCFPNQTGPCRQQGLEKPVIEYGHEDGCSVTGGYVYRGSRLPSLYGAYVYGDFCSGKIWALRHDGVRVTESLELVDSSLLISSFGEDSNGELFVLSFDGMIYQLGPQ